MVEEVWEWQYLVTVEADGDWMMMTSVTWVEEGVSVAWAALVPSEALKFSSYQSWIARNPATLWKTDGNLDVTCAVV